MLIEFDATLDDFLSVSLHSIERSKALRSRRRKQTAITVLAASLVTFALAPVPIVKKLIAALVAAGITLVIDPIIYRRSMQKTLREVCREQMGTDEPFKVRVELTESGILIEQLNTQMAIDWTAVTEIKENGGAIYFYWHDTDCLAVNVRAFESKENKQRFIETALNYMNSSRKPAPSTSADLSS